MLTILLAVGWTRFITTSLISVAATALFFGSVYLIVTEVIKLMRPKK